MGYLDASFRRRYGQWAVVTGASEGIGREVACCLAAAGFDMVLAARRQELLATLAAELESNHKVRIKYVAADLGQAEGTQRVIQATEGLDVGLLVASAGFGTSGPFIGADLQQEVRMLNVNCEAVLRICHHFGGRFAAQKRGGIILMSSLLAFQGVSLAANYAATKAFVQTFAEGLRRELRPFKIDVLAAAPGPVLSGFGARAAMKMTMGLRPPVVAKGMLNALGKSTTVRPGLLSKVLEWSLVLLPRTLRTQILSQVMAAMTGGSH